ncbi:MAG: aminopeptidase P family protein [Paramuribaculum sp.]|nr:aminopeptidase P family protein [Paramuribaculum sp.]
MNETINARIRALRDDMRQAGIDATIIPQTDPHQSEYLADHWQVRRWLSGFTGSAGDLVVTLSEAWLWADSRYWLQAAQQLADTPIAVMEEGKENVPTIAAQLTALLPAGATVGIDGMLFGADKVKALQETLAQKGIVLRADYDPVDRLWTDRPALPQDQVFIHDTKYSGESAESKIERVLTDVAAKGANAIFVSDLAEIAWTLNVRSADVECNPVVTSFLYLSPDSKVLFIDPAKVSADVKAKLSEASVEIQGYGAVVESLRSLPTDTKVLVDGGRTAYALLEALGEKAFVAPSPISVFKAVKNAVQLRGVRDAMVRDGVAMVHSLIEIESKVMAGQPLTELGVVDIVDGNRRKDPLFFDLSFDTIAGYGPHGAIVHYGPNTESNADVHSGSLLLIDSGGNYLDGTTDITRTISLGTPSDAQRRDFTLVMKGHIAVATAIFPAGTRGAQLDVLARINLWKEGLSYLHGTGHGVGHFLNVHEGPQSIRLNDTMAPMEPGMITSNEPGLYREGEYGIRCENLVLTVEAFTTDFGRFLKFETLTWCPFDLQLFDTDIMTDAEIDWVNDYHRQVCEHLLPHLDADAQQWLIEKTQPLTR